MARKRVNKLSDLNIDEVSLVDRGANQHAQVLIHKRDEGEEEETSKASPDTSDLHVEGSIEREEDLTAPSDDDDEETRTKSEGKKTKGDEELGKGFFSRLVSKVVGEEDVEKVNPGAQIPFGMQPQGVPAPGPQGFMPGAPMPGMGMPQAFPAGPGQMPGQMQAAPPLPDEVVQYIQQLEQALAQANQGTNQPHGDSDEEDDMPFGKSAEELSSDEIDFLSELAKNLDDEDQREAINKAMEAVEAANERAERAEEIAKAEQEHRLTQEYVAKAKTLVNLPVDPEQFGPVWKRLRENMPDEDVEILEKALTAANESLGTAGIFTEIGKQGGFGSGSAFEGEVSKALEADETLTREQAVAKVLDQKPDLYDEYLAETRRA